MSFGYAELDLDNQGFVRIDGINNSLIDGATSNGAGKTSCFEAIMWCLQGETIRKSKQVTNINGDDGAYVELDFTADGTDYKLIRTKDHSKYKTNLKIFINGEDKSGKGIRDSEQYLTQYLPELSAQMISSVIILGQGLPMRFTNNTPAGRKEVLESLSQSDFMIEDLKAKLLKRKSVLQDTLNNLNLEQARCQTEKNLIQNIITQTEHQLKNLVVPDVKKLAEIQINIDNLNRVLSENEAQQGIYEQTLYTLMNKSREYQDAKLAEIKAIPNDNELNAKEYSLSNEIKIYRNIIAEKEKVTDVCPTCGQKIEGVVIPDTSQEKIKCEALCAELANVKNEHIKFNNSVDKLRKDIDEKYFKLNKENDENISKIKDLIKLYQKEIAEVSLNLSELKAKEQSISYAIDTYENNKVEFENRIIEKTNRLNELTSNELHNQNEIDLIKQKIDIDNKIDIALKRDFRGYLLTNVIEFINSKVNYYCKYFIENGDIKFTQSGNAINVIFNGKDYECLSGGERQKIDIIIQLALRDMMCTFMNFSSNILVLDEITDFMDNQGSNKLINTISSLIQDVSSIFFVTHHTELNLPYDKIITVIKDKTGISKLI